MASAAAGRRGREPQKTYELHGHAARCHVIMTIGRHPTSRKAADMNDTLATITAGGQIARTANIVDVMDAYIAELDASEKTRGTYARALRQYAAWLEAEGLALERTTRADVMAYKRHLEASKSANTANLYLVAVRGLYSWLNAKAGYPNVAEGVKGLKKAAQVGKDALTLTQARDLLNAEANGEQGLRDRAMVALMLRRGLRTVEVSRADVGDLRQVGGRAVLYVQGKGHTAKDDFVVLGEAAERAISDYLKARRAAGGNVAEGQPLFAATGNRNRGGRMTTRAISRIAKEAMRAQGIDSPHITAHSLRHSAVTLSLIGGATVQEAQAMARHANVATTLIYAHNLERLEAKAETALDVLLAG